MKQQHFGFYHVESSIIEQRARLRAPWDRVVRLHSPNPNERLMRIVTLSDVVTEGPDGFRPSFGGEKLKNTPPCKTAVRAMHHGIQSLHQGFLVTNDIGPYLDVALSQPRYPIVIIDDDTGDHLEIVEMHFHS